MSSYYAKYDSFLKRALPNSEYKEVKAHEPCVVVSSTEKRTFRFSFLTNRRIYITENPPKMLLFHVDIKDVIGIDIVHDVATFLQADLRKQVQHIVIKYTKPKLETRKAKTDFNAADTGSARERRKAARNVERFSEPRSLHTAENHPDVALSSFAQVPFCSFANIETTGQSELKGSDGSTSRKLIPKVARHFIKSKDESKKNQPGKAITGTGTWETKDAYAVHVMVNNHGLDVEELHLYVLNRSTTYLLMLKAIWRNFIIYGESQEGLTKEEGRGVDSVARHDSQGKSQTEISNDEITRALFSELTQELLRAHAIEDLYGLYHELKKASMNDILVKILFWNDDIIFNKTLDLMAKYVENSSAITIHERADEIEMLNIALQTVAMLLREVEAIPKCYRALQNLSHARLFGLINSLLSSPKIPVKVWATDKDIESLMRENAIASSEVLYQLTNASDQVCWITNIKHSSFGSVSLFQMIDKNGNLLKFLDRLLHACAKIWHNASNRHSPFSVEQAINVYHMFTVVHRVIVRSPAALRYVKESFQEEFRYYINPSSVAMRFPASYRISAMARAVVHTVGAVVTGVSSHS